MANGLNPGVETVWLLWPSGWESAFHEHLNDQNPDIQFTKEIEENGQLPFLDCLVSRDSDKLRTTVYRKPIHTDKVLDQSSYNLASHKAATVKTLTKRAQLLCLS